jgi:hypothetical protein
VTERVSSFSPAAAPLEETKRRNVEGREHGIDAT